MLGLIDDVGYYIKSHTSYLRPFLGALSQEIDRMGVVALDCLSQDLAQGMLQSASRGPASII